MSDFLDLNPEQYEQMTDGGYFPAHRESKWCLGWDPAQSVDFSALVLCEATRDPIEPRDGTDWLNETTLRQKLSPQTIRIQTMVRLPPRMNYVDQIYRVKALLQHPMLRDKKVELVLDRSGCGRPLGDQCRQLGLRPTLITIVGGTHEASDNDGALRVPKQTLITLLQACLNNGEIKYPAKHPETPELLKQLANFTATISQSGAAAYAAAGGAGNHDDLVLALSYCLHRLSNRRSGGHYSVQQLAL
jgi:hypothetical protein